MLKVGQELWFVPSRRFSIQPRAVAVLKVGRVWADIGTHRIDKTTLAVDSKGYASPGRCYLSRLEWELETAAEAAWVGLQRNLRNRISRPHDLGADAIREAARLLGLEITP